MDYPCTGCSQCCRRIQAVLEMSHDHPVIQELVHRFPYQSRQDGSCEMLTTEGRCSVYDSRPLLCNIQLGAKLLKMDEQEWYRLNQLGCNEMIREAGLDESFLVTLDF
jgi:Fe-S-cluster containining protein